jgi:hypothetical protein
MTTHDTTTAAAEDDDLGTSETISTLTLDANWPEVRLEVFWHDGNGSVGLAQDDGPYYVMSAATARRLADELVKSADRTEGHWSPAT